MNLMIKGFKKYLIFLKLFLQQLMYFSIGKDQFDVKSMHKIIIWNLIILKHLADIFKNDNNPYYINLYDQSFIYFSFSSIYNRNLKYIKKWGDQENPKEAIGCIKTLSPDTRNLPDNTWSQGEIILNSLKSWEESACPFRNLQERLTFPTWERIGILEVIGLLLSNITQVMEWTVWFHSEMIKQQWQ